MAEHTNMPENSGRLASVTAAVIESAVKVTASNSDDTIDGNVTKPSGNEPDAGLSNDDDVAKQKYFETDRALGTKTLFVSRKRFYLDLKENRRGKYLRIAEVTLDGRRNQIFMSLATAIEFHDNLKQFVEFYERVGSIRSDYDMLVDDCLLKSMVMFKESRRYYLDLKENQRGRFLRVSQTIGRNSARFHIAIPALALRHFRDCIGQLIERFYAKESAEENAPIADSISTPANTNRRKQPDVAVTGAGAALGTVAATASSRLSQTHSSRSATRRRRGGRRVLRDLPTPRILHVDKESFFFDVKQNRRGVFMSISEIKHGVRTAITIPEKAWGRFYDIISELCYKINIDEANDDADDADDADDGNDDDEDGSGANNDDNNNDEDDGANSDNDGVENDVEGRPEPVDGAEQQQQRSDREPKDDQDATVLDNRENVADNASANRRSIRTACAGRGFRWRSNAPPFCSFSAAKSSPQPPFFLQGPVVFRGVPINIQQVPIAAGPVAQNAMLQC